MPRPSVPAIIQFGSGANPASEIGQFGSYVSPQYGNSLSLLMSGTAWARGWFGETINTNRPFIQDFNAIDFAFCSYLFYLMTLGIPEYIATMTYWTNSIVQSSGQLYTSIADSNQGNTPASSPTKWQPGLPGAEITGVIKAWPGVVAPSGYLLCQGQAVNRTTYATLFAVCGVNYGAGDGSTTFNLPNFQGKIPVGLLSGDSNFGTLGQAGGEQTHTLTVSELPSYTVQVPVYFFNSGSGTGIQGTSGTGSSQSTINVPAGGNGTPHNNIQPYQVVNYIIKT